MYEAITRLIVASFWNGINIHDHEGRGLKTESFTLQRSVPSKQVAVSPADVLDRQEFVFSACASSTFRRNLQASKPRSGSKAVYHSDSEITSSDTFQAGLHKQSLP